MKHWVLICALAIFAAPVNAQQRGKPIIYVDVQALDSVAQTEGYPLDAQSVRLQVGQALSVRGYNWQPMDNRPTGNITKLVVHFTVQENETDSTNVAVASASTHFLESVKVGTAREVTLSLENGLVQTMVSNQDLTNARIQLRIAFSQALTMRLNEALNDYENKVLFR